MTSVRENVAAQVALPWVVRLRYLMAMWQIARILFVGLVLDVQLPMFWLLLMPVIVLVSNGWLTVRVLSPRGVTIRAQRPEWIIAGVVVLDTLCFTAALMLTGGPDNPYNVLYLVHVAIAAMVLPRWHGRGLAAFACLCYGAVFRFHAQVPELSGESVSALHLLGVWLSFAAAVFLLTVFSGKISELLRGREESLLRLRQQLDQKDRLASLATLAAGAAHELNTPLGTIAVIARELERYATVTQPNEAMALDCGLIRGEVGRCREILERMSADGADPTGETPEAITASGFLEEVQEGLPEAERRRVRIEADDSYMLLVIPMRAVGQALTALVRNAIDASPAEAPILLAARQAGPRREGYIRFEVRDRGCGMSEETQRRAGEPFYTTKEPGKGMGLGVFLARTLADRLGGELTFESPGRGTVATLEIPRAPVTEAVEV
ncbi:MAG TPA: ATP-binding protein [Bryobacteraceae bacterium]|nr:ATP-binding protein [Bryobacteraceae bacterium]